MIKQGLYLYSRISDAEREKIAGGGVAKKMLSTVEVFNMNNLSCTLKNVIFSSNHWIRIFCYMFSRSVFWKQIRNIDFSTISYIYMRQFRPHSLPFLVMLKKIKKNNPNCLIIYEIPTYPYDTEFKGLNNKFFMLVDRFFVKYAAKYFDKIVTYSQDSTIFGVETIKAINGIDLSAITVRKWEPHPYINLVAVARFSPWHGYDRLIYGLAEYYRKNPKIKVIFNLAGDGESVEFYKDLVRKLSLEDYVIFHGALYGTSLRELFNKSDIAVCSLGNFRKNLFLTSELKSREYMAYGMPMVAATKIDILNTGYPYLMYVPEDESPININSILKFYDGLQKKESIDSLTKNIRDFADKNCNMKVALQPIVDYIVKNIDKLGE